MRGTQTQPVFQHQEGRVKGGAAGVGMALSVPIKPDQNHVGNFEFPHLWLPHFSPGESA
jgi:hypothetical protein